MTALRPICGPGMRRLPAPTARVLRRFASARRTPRLVSDGLIAHAVFLAQTPHAGCGLRGGRGAGVGSNEGTLGFPPLAKNLVPVATRRRNGLDWPRHAAAGLAALA